jgi:hypothetical protein
LRLPSPAGGKGIDKAQAVPVLAVLGRVVHDRGERTGVGNDDHDRPGAFQAHQLEADRIRPRVRYGVCDQLRRDRFGTLSAVTEVVMTQCRPDVEARHPHRIRGTWQRERDQ